MPAREKRFTVIRKYRAIGSKESICVVQLVVPEAVWDEFVKALDLAALVTGSDRMGQQLLMLAAEATTEWLKLKGR